MDSDLFSLDGEEGFAVGEDERDVQELEIEEQQEEGFSLFDSDDLGDFAVSGAEKKGEDLW